MLCNNYHRSVRRGPALAAAMLALSAVAMLAAPARAAIDAASFTLKFSEKEKALSDPNNTDLQHFLMWDLGADRVVARNMPFLELQNDSTSDAPITELRMSIGDARFNFNCQILGSCAKLAKSTPGVDLSSAVASGGDELVLTIGDGGLAAGEVVRFRIALARDAANLGLFHMPDFRTVLFDMNGVGVYDGNLHSPSSLDQTLDNSEFSAKFTMGAVTKTIGPVALDDYSVTSVAKDYFNDHYRRYGVMEPVESFLAIGAGGVIPEPGSALLAMIGLVGAALPLKRARRSAAFSRQTH